LILLLLTVWLAALNTSSLKPASQLSSLAGLLPSVESGIFTSVLAVNLRNQIRASDTTPLQFHYEAASCRIFYTLDNVYKMSKLWRDTVSAAFDDRSRCVQGSTGFTLYSLVTV
jgi:hypothetical protein